MSSALLLALACGQGEQPVVVAEAPVPPAPVAPAKQPGEDPLEVRIDAAQDLPAALAAWRKAASEGGTVVLKLGPGPLTGSLSLTDPFAAKLPRVEVHGSGTRWSAGSLTIAGSEIVVRELVVEDAPLRLEASERISFDRVAVLSSRAPGAGTGAHTAALGLDLVARGPSVRAVLLRSVLATIDPKGALTLRTSSAGGGRFASVELADCAVLGQVKVEGGTLPVTLAGGLLVGAGEGLLLGEGVERRPWAVGGETPWAEAARALDLQRIK